jgi:hypothetical protein
VWLSAAAGDENRRAIAIVRAWRLFSVRPPLHNPACITFSRFFTAATARFFPSFFKKLRDLYHVF